jgi:ligand-binding SRPBCC domain-containing protein
VRIFELEREQRVARPRDRLFRFFSRPENLALITPPDLGFRLLTPSPVEMRRGRLIDYRIRLMGLPVRWRTLISSYEPPQRFVDEQLLGPYSFWYHEHLFESLDGGTLLIDRVRYALPLAAGGPLGDALHSLCIRPSLERIFDYRREVFASLFGAPAPTQSMRARA